MKKTLISLAIALTFTCSAHAQGIAACQTMEQAQAAYNKSKAQGIAVRDTASQQLQCHYWQLGVYWQQLHTSIQQEQKDTQQKNKDQQQISKDIQQIAFDKALKEREAQCGVVCSDDELTQFLDVLIPFMDTASCHDIKHEIEKLHLNRSGGGDNTNNGGGGNENGYLNPGFNPFHKVR